MSGIQAERTTQVEEKKQRDSNFELMRIVAMLLIVLHHLCQQGLWFSPENSHSLNSNVASSFSVWTELAVYFDFRIFWCCHEFFLEKSF